jgi:uncharacterized protein YceH (UPF0502 family)
MTEAGNLSEDAVTWQPIGRNERRVLGVLVEKAKTTPESYPLTLASLVAGSNQKSNRSPQMQLDDEEVTLALDHLKAVGAVREIQGSGRVNKYRHAAYEWLGVDAAGAAVMAELLLRGPQTAGELRARASRMHEFADLETLSSVLDRLQQTGLVQALTPPGRGQTFAHALYPPDEQQYLAQKVLAQVDDDLPVKSVVAGGASHGAVANGVAELRERVEQLELQVEELKRRLDRVAVN